MAYSKVTIVFNQAPASGHYIYIKEISKNINIIEMFKEQRLAPSQAVLPMFQLADETNPDRYIGYASENYKNAFNLDYNSTNLFTITSINGPIHTGTGTVIIESNYSGANFSLMHNDVYAAVVTITNETAIPEIKILNTDFSNATTNQCQNVKVNIETTILATKILSPIVVNPNTDNPFSFDWLRGQTINIIVEDSNGKRDNKSVTTPSVLTAENFTITSTNSPNGGTAIIVPIGLSGLELEYSLDNIDWQSENVFSGLEIGDYTVYIRDNFGCSTSKSFAIDQFNITEPYFYISKANSLRFAERVDWDDITVFKTDENTLSCESDVPLPYQEIQDFKTEDVITTQFKSNYSKNTVKVIVDGYIPTPIPDKSNDLLYSEDFSNSIWIKNLLNFSAKKVIPTSVSGYHNIIQSIDKGDQSGDYTLSMYAKPDELNKISFTIQNPEESAQVLTGFDFSTLSFFGDYGFGGFTFISSAYTAEDDGYYRISMKVNLSTIENIEIKLSTHSNSGSSNFTGNNVDGLFIDKVQFQKGDLTDYVPTLNEPVVEEGSDGYPEIPIYKKSNNIGIKDKRQAIKYDLGNSKTGIYFSAGNTYDFDTNVINGSYVLNGGVPEWGRIGNYLLIDSAWFEIEQIIYDEAKTADVLVISNVYTGIDASIIVGSIYNRDNFEVYEFIVNMVDYEDNLFRVRINAENDLFPDVEYLSEEINVSNNVEDLLEIRYKNTSNTDINYSTGIEHLIRVPFNKITGQYDEESETYKTDTTSKLLSADLYEVDEFVLEPNTKEIWRKINIALTHEIVIINGVSYVKNASFNTEPLGETNLYVLSAAMVKTGNVYNISSNDTFEYSDEGVEIPNLIETEEGFVEY